MEFLHLNKLTLSCLLLLKHKFKLLSTGAIITIIKAYKEINLFRVEYCWSHLSDFYCGIQ